MTLKRAVAKAFEVREFPYSINLYSEDSNLRIQVRTDPRYQAFVESAEEHDVLGYTMMVASLEDVLRGKIWAYSDEQRRRSKRQKDLADIFRIVESYPELESMLTPDIRDRM